MIILSELDDPRLVGLPSITRVEVTDDLAIANVFVSIMASEGKQTAALNALKHSSGMMRSKLAGMMEMRQVPYIKFHIDESLKKERVVLDLLRKVAEEQAEKQKGQAAEGDSAEEAGEAGAGEVGEGQAVEGQAIAGQGKEEQKKVARKPGAAEEGDVPNPNGPLDGLDSVDSADSQESPDSPVGPNGPDSPVGPNGPNGGGRAAP